MFCMSCQMEINPKWKHAIEINICPFCGNEIMSEELKTSLTSLREIMDSLQEYPNELDDWMQSNFNYIKIDSPNLINYLSKDQIQELYKNSRKLDDSKQVYTVKVKNDKGQEEEVIAEKIQSEDKTMEFFKRADAIKPKLDGFNSPAEKTQRLKELKKKIEKAGAISINANEEAELISPEMLENADPEAVEEFQHLISSPNVSSYEDDEEIPGESVINAMVNFKNKGSSGADISKLQNMHNRLHESRKNFNTGAKGSFSRS